MSGSDPGKSTRLPVVAVDTGGTFTDLLLLEGDRLQTLKVPSSPHDPAQSVLLGIEELLGPSDSRVPFLLIHGSTVATNAILERKGARVGLVTNRGFEDLVEIGRQDRPQLYALVGTRPPPPVNREDRIGIRGRLGAGGEVVEPLDPAELQELPSRLAQVEAVAVVLLHSYANPAHEVEVMEALQGLEVPVAASSRILPEFREYERTSTTVVNAYVAPRMSGYLGRLERESGAAAVRIMGSAGGVLPLRMAVEEPVRTVLSGPAGGVTGAQVRGAERGAGSLLTFDMGGTSTDVSLVPGRILQTREGQVGGLPVAIPMVDIHTVGAGGGSLAWVDPAGALRVGPESAGAEPGPICYGKGGDRVTVTDAHVWLGRLPSSAFLGGSRALDRDAIGGPLSKLGRAVGLDPGRTAEGILEVADATMERALRVISVERGVDPRELHLVAFGGAAGLHAAELARRLGTRGVLLPPDPGLASAWGMLAAPVVRDRTRTILLRSDEGETASRLEEALEEMEEEAREELVQEGFQADALRSRRQVDARYPGQSWELTVPARRWTEHFHEAHEERYGYRRQDRPVEAVTLRVRVEAAGFLPPSAGSPSSPSGPRGRKEGETPVESATVEVRWEGRTTEARLLYRTTMEPGERWEGPAVVAEYSATTWCPPGWRLQVGEDLLMELSPS